MKMMKKQQHNSPSRSLCLLQIYPIAMTKMNTNPNKKSNLLPQQNKMSRTRINHLSRLDLKYLSKTNLKRKYNSRMCCNMSMMRKMNPKKIMIQIENNNILIKSSSKLRFKKDLKRKSRQRKHNIKNNKTKHRMMKMKKNNTTRREKKKGENINTSE